jgi:hypothetical protein
VPSTAVAILLAIAASPASAAVVGPETYTDIGATFASGGTSPLTGARTWDYSNINLAQFEHLWFGFTGVGAATTGGAPVTFTSVSASGSQAMWSGTSTITGALFSGSVQIELLATIISGASGWDTNPSGLGIPPGTLAVAELNGNDFEVSYQWLAKDSQYPTFTALKTVFDSAHATTGSLQTSVGGAFYSVEAAVPEPSTWAMMILGFAGVGFLSYRRSGTFRLT